MLIGKCLSGYCESRSRLLEVCQPPHQGFFFLWAFVSSTTCPCTTLVLQIFEMRSSSKCQCHGLDNSHTSLNAIWFPRPWPFGLQAWRDWICSESQDVRQEVKISVRRADGSTTLVEVASFYAEGKQNERRFFSCSVVSW